MGEGQVTSKHQQMRKLRLRKEMPCRVLDSRLPQQRGGHFCHQLADLGTDTQFIHICRTMKSWVADLQGLTQCPEFSAYYVIGR